MGILLKTSFVREKMFLEQKKRNFETSLHTSMGSKRCEITNLWH